jgi:hypothetical protein
LPTRRPIAIDSPPTLPSSARPGLRRRAGAKKGRGGWRRRRRGVTPPRSSSPS